MDAPRNMTAALLAMGSTAILSFVDNFVASVAETHGLWQFQVVRALIVIPLLVLGAMVLRQRLRPVSLRRLAIRSATVTAGLLVYFAALGTLSVAQAGAGIFSAPIWVMILSVVLFRSPVSGWQIVAILAGFVGVLMVLQPDPDRLSPASLLPLAAGVFYGLGMMLTRFWCAEETAMALALGVFSAVGLASLFLLLMAQAGLFGDTGGFLDRGWEPLTGRFLWLTAMQGVGAIVAVSLIAQAYRIGTPSFVAVFEYSFLVFAALWTLLLWGQGTNLLAWAGIAVILISGGMMSLSERRRGRVAQTELPPG